MELTFQGTCSLIINRARSPFIAIDRTPSSVQTVLVLWLGRYLED